MIRLGATVKFGLIKTVAEFKLTWESVEGTHIFCIRNQPNPHSFTAITIHEPFEGRKTQRGHRSIKNLGCNEVKLVIIKFIIIQVGWHIILRVFSENLEAEVTVMRWYIYVPDFPCKTGNNFGEHVSK